MSDTTMLKLFGDSNKPDKHIAWQLYEQGKIFNNRQKLDEMVKVNRNFFIGKQWEGVESNGLPEPTFNFIARDVGFVISSINSDNIKAYATVLANTVGTGQMDEYVRIVNEEFDALTEQNHVPALVKKMSSNAAVDKDGCIYTYWDAEAETGQEAKGAIRSEIIPNTRVFFGDPNSSDEQCQPWIMIVRRLQTREAAWRAKENDGEWENIKPDTEGDDATDSAKLTFDKTTVITLLYKAKETEKGFCEKGDICAYEFTRTAEIRKPWNLGIKLYPVVWFNWHEVEDSYHGTSMVDALIPNQVFVNKIYAMIMLNYMRQAFGKVIFDKTKVTRWDNRVGGAIGVNGNVDAVAKILDPPALNPAVYQFAENVIDTTGKMLGATSVALGDTRPDNTSAIIALQKAASTPHETIKQRLYEKVEGLYRIYLDFMGEYYGERWVDRDPTEREKQAAQFVGMPAPDAVPAIFDFSQLKNHPMTLKLDVGGSTNWSQTATLATLDNMLMNGAISPRQYVERLPEEYIPAKHKLLKELEEKELQEKMMSGMMPMPMGGGGAAPQNPLNPMPEGGLIPDEFSIDQIPVGSGNGGMQRDIVNKDGTAQLM